MLSEEAIAPYKIYEDLCAIHLMLLMVDRIVGRAHMNRANQADGGEVEKRERVHDALYDCIESIEEFCIAYNIGKEINYQKLLNGLICAVVGMQDHEIKIYALEYRVSMDNIYVMEGETQVYDGNTVKKLSGSKIRSPECGKDILSEKFSGKPYKTIQDFEKCMQAASRSVGNRQSILCCMAFLLCICAEFIAVAKGVIPAFKS